MTLSQLHEVTEPKELLPLLRDLNVVAVALLTRDGVLEDANTGFLRMIPGDCPASALLDVRHVFVHPRFDQFSARQADPADGSVYRGILNVGGAGEPVRSLRGAIYAFGDHLLFLAEHDLEQLEKNVASVQLLNEQLAESAREIARLERAVRLKENAAKRAVADREALLAVLAGEMQESKEK